MKRIIPPLGRVAILLLLSLPASYACGPSAEEREQAAADARRARVQRSFQDAILESVRHIQRHCKESPQQLSRLFARDSDLTVVFNGQPYPVLSFAAFVDRATVHHDSTKSCATLIDSVASALRLHPVQSRR